MYMTPGRLFSNIRAWAQCSLASIMGRILFEDWVVQNRNKRQLSRKSALGQQVLQQLELCTYRQTTIHESLQGVQEGQRPGPEWHARGINTHMLDTSTGVKPLSQLRRPSLRGELAGSSDLLVTGINRRGTVTPAGDACSSPPLFQKQFPSTSILSLRRGVNR
jgi:hypothetical protein